MASGIDEKESPPKEEQKPLSQVNFHLDSSHHTDESLEEHDEFLEFSSLSHNPSSSSLIDSSTIYTKPLSNYEHNSKAKRYSR
jgi:hypothetical protein